MGNATETIASAASGSFTIGFEVAVIALAVCVIMAFFAMRFYKLFMSLFAAGGIGVIAYSLFAPGGMLAGYMPAVGGANAALVVSIVAAIGGFTIGILMPKFVLFLGGVGLSVVATRVLVPLFIPSLHLDGSVMLVAGLVAGLVVGVLLCLVFKPIYIFITAFGCSAIAGVLLVSLVAPGTSVLIGAVGGAVFGIIPAIHQFRWSAYRV